MKTRTTAYQGAPSCRPICKSTRSHIRIVVEAIVCQYRNPSYCRSPQQKCVAGFRVFKLIQCFRHIDAKRAEGKLTHSDKRHSIDVADDSAESESKHRTKASTFSTEYRLIRSHLYMSQITVRVRYTTIRTDRTKY